MRNMPPPGTPCGPFDLPASYRTYQLIQMGFVKGRYSSSYMRWEVPDENGGWRAVYSPKQTVGPSGSSPRRASKMDALPIFFE